MPNNRNLWHAGICRFRSSYCLFGLQGNESKYTADLKSLSKFVDALETTELTPSNLLPIEMANTTKNLYHSSFLTQAKSKLKGILKNIYSSAPLNIKTKRKAFSLAQKLRNKFNYLIKNDREGYANTIFKNKSEELRKIASTISFENFSNPEITIIIPCYDQINYTISCLPLFSKILHPQA